MSKQPTDQQSVAGLLTRAIDMTSIRPPYSRLMTSSMASPTMRMKSASLSDTVTRSTGFLVGVGIGFVSRACDGDHVTGFQIQVYLFPTFEEASCDPLDVNPAG